MDSNNTTQQSDIAQRLGEGAGRATTVGVPSSGKTTINQNSVVEYYGSGANYCGYCKRDETECEGRRNHDMKAYHLRPNDYQQLMDRGWRRSGRFCYRPINSQSCCPNYPLSCETPRFRLSKSQRRCIENLNSYLVNGSVQNRVKLNYGSHNDDKQTDYLKTKLEQLIESKTFEELKNSTKARDKRFVASCERKVKLYNLTLDESIKRTIKKNLIRAKQNNSSANLEDYLYPIRANLPQTLVDSFQCMKHSLTIKMHYVDCQYSRAIRFEENELIQRYQKEIHKEGPEEWTMTRYFNFLIDSPIVVEPFLEEQQMNETMTKRIEANQNLDYLLVSPPDLPTAYGTYHCVYYLDGKMIAVGVLDVLPKCITTVYFFYEPEYGFLNLGIYSALVEISMVRQMHRHFSNQSKLIYYYLGFYVHESKKMHYKTKFYPSYLLCSVTSRYVPLETCLKLLEGRKYSRFDMSPTAGDHNGLQQDDCDFGEELDNFNGELTKLSVLDIPVITPVTSTTKMTDYFEWLTTNFGENYVRLTVEKILVPYMRLIGPSLVPRITLKMQFIHRALAEKHHWQTNQPSDAARRL